MSPFEPIPDRTHVGGGDRLLGATVGAYRVLEHVAEGRLGTVYFAQEIVSGKQVTLEVLRTGRVGNDEEARAANAIRCAGIAEVQAFGQLPDERRYRVMERLEGESLEQLLQRRGPLAAREAVSLLIEVAGVLEASHAWAITHGLLGPSSVWVVNGAVKLIDFGLAKAAAREVDLQALGALGFALLTGKEVEGPPPALGARSPALLGRLLRELLEKRVADATAAKRELEQLLTTAAPRRRSALPFVLAAVVVALAAGVFFSSGAQTVAPAPVVAEPLAELLSEEELIEPDEPLVPDPVSMKPVPRVMKQARSVPSAQALQELTSKLEARLRKKARPGDDLDQALFVLNKQRLQLTGNPSEAERKEVARQLAGWRRSYLH